MKISIDSVLGQITDEATNETFTFKTCFYDKGYTINNVLRKILSSSQYKKVIEQDGVFTLSKKGEKALKEEINKLNQIK